MPETRYVSTYENGVLVSHEPYEVSDEQQFFEQRDKECNEQHQKGILAYNNWPTLTMSQKDSVLKELLGCMLSVLRKLGYFVL